MPNDLDDLLSRIAPRIAEARSAWPRVVVPDDVFAAFVAERVPPPADDSALAALAFADLYLACACARRDPAALAAFEERYAPEVLAMYERSRGTPLDRDEALQRVRQKLFVDEPPAIAAYGGRGSLHAWLRVVVTRMLLNARERETKEKSADADFFDAIVASDDGAEVELLKRSMAAGLRAALLDALESLTHREKALLRYAYCDERTVDEIAAIYGVHRATAARWVVKARERLVDRTHALLEQRFGASRSEIRSIVRLGVGIIDTTFARHLAAEA
jgi:RNA polymerase sigma-70 factor (ECF subfamily)